jgi:putative NADPH-quinone reductase
MTRRVLIIAAHPDLSRSNTNAGLLDTVRNNPAVTVHELYSVYPNGKIDYEYERKLLLDADAIVFQFPFYWYSTPSLLKEWQDQVLTRMIYVDFDASGTHLVGKPVMLSITTGGPCESYSREGRNRFEMSELLGPLEATTHRCGLQWRPPFIVHAGDALNPEERATCQGEFATRIDRLLNDAPAWSEGEYENPTPIV